MRSLEKELAVLKAESMRRSLRTLDGPQSVEMTAAGAPLLNFSSNDYLGLAADPRVIEAMQRGVEKYGAGAGGSRLICGGLTPHAELEEGLAAFKGTAAALGFSSGYAAAIGTVGALARRGDVVILDKLAHASLIDGARLSGATLRVFAHNRLDQLEARLKWATGQAGRGGRVLVVTESIFSMDGDRAPLREMGPLVHRHGALLLVDEAHAFGLCGHGGRGLADELGVSEQVDFHLGTLSKAAGLSGGYVCGSRAAIDLLINRARSFIYSTAPPPAVAAAAAMVVRDLLPSDIGNRARERLWRNAVHFLERDGRDHGPPASAIMPVLIGDEAKALEIARRLQAAGFLVPAIRHPSVPRGQARLRITLSARHEPEQIDRLHAALRDAFGREPSPP